MPTPHLVSSERISPTTVTLFRNRKLDTLALWQADPRLLAANDTVYRLAGVHDTIALRAHIQDVALTSGELVVDRVLHVHNVETSIVTLAVGDDTDTTLYPVSACPQTSTCRRTMLRPPVIMTMTPVSNLMKSVILPVARSILTVSLTLTAGSG